MEENETQTSKEGMVRPALMTAFLIAAAIIILNLIYYIAGSITHSSLGWISLALLLGGLIYGVITFRNENLGGYISYGKSLGFSVLTGLFVGVITGIFALILYGIIDPGLIETLKAEAEKTVYQNYHHFDYDQQEAMIKMQQRFISPLILSISSVFVTVIQALLIGLIVSIFLKKKKPLDAQYSEQDKA